MLIITPTFDGLTRTDLLSIPPCKRQRCLLLAAFLSCCSIQRVLAGEVSSSDNPLQNHTSGNVAKAHQLNKAQTLLLDVTINGRTLPSIIPAEKLADGRLVVSEKAWLEAHLRPTGTKLTLPDNKLGYALDDIPELSYQLDTSRLALHITVPAEAFETNTLADGRGGPPPPNPASPGAYFNYNLNGSRSSDSRLNYGAFLEGVAFNNLGSLVVSGVMRGSGNQHKIIRADSYLQKDLPGSMETLVIGDTISSGGAWSRPVRFGGIRWARNFSLRPGYFTFPLPSVSGSAALPSTIDVLVNNQRQQSGTVDSGPFTIANVPVVTGAGQINVVVRDMLGVETQKTIDYYTSPRLLAPGLTDFSLEAGFLRQNYGNQSFNYNSPFTAGTWRRGFSNTFSGEARLELQEYRQAAGLEIANQLGHLAVAHAAVAYAKTKDEQGSHYLLGLERRTLHHSGSLQWEYFDQDYSQFGASTSETRPRSRLSAGYGTQVFQGISAGISYIGQSSWNDDRFRLASANLGISLPWNMYFNAYAGKQFDQYNGWSGTLNLTLPLGSQRTVSASSIYNTDGRITNTLQVNQSVPQGPGLGWRLRASDDPGRPLQVGGTINTNSGQLAADVNMDNNGTAVRLNANGSAGWIQDLPFATRLIGHGSFAVVKVDSLKEIPVYRDNQVVGITNDNGIALAPNLLPYQKNRLSIDPGELPFDVEIKAIKQETIPYARSGVLVKFPIRHSRNALVVLQQADGKPVPAGARVTVTPSGLSFTVAKRGQVYLTNLESDNHITVQWPNGDCSLSIALPADTPVEPHIGPVTCGVP